MEGPLRTGIVLVTYISLLVDSNDDLGVSYCVVG